MKKTKRKGFNFFRSYYDVFNELKTKKDKLAFIEALLDKQFLGINPENLEGMAKFAWISQVNSIDSQVKGYEDKTKTKLTPTDGVNTPPTEQVEVEEKVEGEEKAFSSIDKFLKWYSEEATKLTKKDYAVRVVGDEEKNIFAELNTKYSFEEFKKALNSFFSESSWHKTNELITPKSFLKIDNFNKYLNSKVKAEKTMGQKLAGL